MLASCLSNCGFCFIYCSPLSCTRSLESSWRVKRKRKSLPCFLPIPFSTFQLKTSRVWGKMRRRTWWNECSGNLMTPRRHQICDSRCVQTTSGREETESKNSLKRTSGQTYMKGKNCDPKNKKKLAWGHTWRCGSTLERVRSKWKHGCALYAGWVIRETKGGSSNSNDETRWVIWK